MRKLDPRFIDSLTKEASRAMRAIRSIQALEENLPDCFPEPTSINAGRKPYDLVLEWEAGNHKHAASLRDKITRFLKLDSKWNPTEDGLISCKCCVRVGGKATLNLCLQIKSLFSIAGTVTGRWSGR